MTKSDKDELVTRGMLQEAADTILAGIDILFKNVATKDDLKKLATKEDLRQVRQELKTDISHVKDDIKGLTAEFSDTPSRGEFNKLDSKLDKHVLNHNN